MQTYHDTFGFMPPAVKRDANGRALWSWRVELLPYLEQQNLYQQLNPNEPWNGPTNSRVLANMPKVFEMPGQAEKNQTHYQVFVGPGAPFSNDPTVRQGPRLTQITDGTSNTILIVEAAQAVSWAAPGDLSFNEKVPFSPFLLGVGPGNTFNVAMMDGSVQRIKRSVNPQVLQWAIMPNDGNPLPANWGD
jgi:hypothetical protein